MNKSIFETSLDILRQYVNANFGGNVAAAARSLDVKYVTLNNWLIGERSPSLSVIGPILDRLGAQLLPPGDKQEDYEFEYLRHVEAKAGAGSSLVTGSGTSDLYAFRRQFLITQHINPKEAILIDVIGDSMQPLLADGDTLLIDLADKEIADGKIYLVALGEELLIKRVLRHPRGLVLHSENQSYSDVFVEPEDIGGRFVVHGRLRWYGRIY